MQFHDVMLNIAVNDLHVLCMWAGVDSYSIPFRFVSDHAPLGCQALLQHRLIQANQKLQLGTGPAPDTARTYPLSLLEWTANRKKANMVLQVHCFDGKLDFFHLFFVFRAGSNVWKSCLSFSLC